MDNILGQIGYSSFDLANLNSNSILVHHWTVLQVKLITSFLEEGLSPVGDWAKVDGRGYVNKCQLC